MNDRLPRTPSLTSSSPASRPSPPGGLRPALTPTPGELPSQPAGEANPNNKSQVSTVSGDCRLHPFSTCRGAMTEQNLVLMSDECCNEA